MSTDDYKCVYNHDYPYLVVGLDGTGDLMVEGFETLDEANAFVEEYEYKCGLISGQRRMLEPASLHWEDHT